MIREGEGVRPTDHVINVKKISYRTSRQMWLTPEGGAGGSSGSHSPALLFVKTWENCKAETADSEALES